MCDTYASFARTDHEGYRQHSLIMSRRSNAGFYIGSEFIQPLFSTDRYRIIDKLVTKDKDTSEHYVMEIPIKNQP